MRYFNIMKMKNLLLSLLMIGLLFTPLTAIYAAELPVDVRNILLKITSSIVDQGVSTIQTEASPAKLLTKELNESLSPLAISSSQLYFPLNNSDVKYYEGLVLGTTYYGTYTYSQVSYYGRTCFLEHDSLDGSNTYYGYSGSGLEMYGAAVGNESYKLNSPLLILSDAILNSGGTIQSSTTLTVEGYLITLSAEITSTLIGSVTIPLGTADNCRSIDMSFSYTYQGEPVAEDLRDVWILAPEIGKLKIAVMEQMPK